MKKTILWVAAGCVIIAAGLQVSAEKNKQLYKKDAPEIKLPAPDMKGGKPLMDCLRERSTIRVYSDKKLSKRVLSNLLWAAFGINRPESGKRTAPSARNWQEIDIYVAAEDGLYYFDAVRHSLRKLSDEDIRAATGRQAFVTDAPINLIYVADYSKISGAEDMKDFYSAADTGFISQNVYLFCASEGLGTVVRGLVDREDLSKVMGLRDDQKIILAQTVGYPQENTK